MTKHFNTHHSLRILGIVSGVLAVGVFASTYIRGFNNLSNEAMFWVENSQIIFMTSLFGLAVYILRTHYTKNK